MLLQVIILAKLSNVHKEIYTDIFTIVLSEMVKNEKQSNCSSTKERILKQAGFIQIMECCKAVKTN